MAVDGKVVYEVDYDTKKAKSGLKGLGTTIANVGDKAGKLGSTLNKNVTAPLLAIGGAAIGGFMKISSTLDDIAKSAAGVGAGVEGLQAWQFAGKKAGVEADKMTDTLRKVQELATRNADAFFELGVQTTDTEGNMRDSDAIMSDLIGSLDGMGTAERNATLLALGFTRELETVNKLMEDTDGLAANVETGLENAIPDETIKDFEEFNDKLEDIKGLLAPVGVEIATALLPHLEDLADWFADDGIEKVEEFVTKLITFTEENWKLIAALAALGPALTVFSKLITVGTGIANMTKKLNALVTAAKAAKAVTGVTTATTATTGAAGAGAGISGLGIIGGAAGITAGVVAADAAMMALKEAKPENFESFIGKKATDVYYGMPSSDYADVSGYGGGGGVTIAKVEVNATTDLSPENGGRVVDDIMYGVTDELQLRSVMK